MVDKYNASNSMIGYLYQCRYALMAGIGASKTKPNLSISIEKFDDVAFDDSGSPTELIQTKHHSKSGDLTDNSVDLWKTLQIWMDQIAKTPQLLFETQFTILTTGRSPNNSASSCLHVGRCDDDINSALEKLLATAKSSTNQMTAKARETFINLKDVTRLNLLRAIIIIDNSPNIINVRSEIENLLFLTVPEQHLSSFVDYLEGWWFSTVIRNLQKGNKEVITVNTIRKKIDELSEGFKPGKLPFEDIIIDQEVTRSLISDNRKFVQQIHSINLKNEIVELAARDYYRASTQRSKWARENLLLDGETNRYDEELTDCWERKFELQKAEADLNNEASKISCGREIYKWVNNQAVPFRNRHEAWLTTGTYHILADNLKVGWHPDFEKLFYDEEVLP